MNLASEVMGHREDAPAVHHDGRWATWGEVRARAAAVTAQLGRLGVSPGDRVAIARPSSAEFVACYLGVLAAGAVAVPLNPASPLPELAGELTVVRPVALLAGEPLSSALGEGIGEVPVIAEVSPGGSDPFSPLELHDADPAVLLFTSGTAGAPRPAVLSHGNLRANLRQMLSLPGQLSRPDDVGLTAVPLFHIFGLNVALGLSLVTGAAVVLCEHFDADASLELAGRLGVTALIGVPAMFGAWAETIGAATPSPFPRVRLAVSGATALPTELATSFEERAGIALSQGYGLTEASPVVSTTVGTGRNRPGSVGRPLPGIELRLVDELGGDVLDGDPGEIWVRGPNVFCGYFEDPAATSEVLTGDGWLRTGDVGVVGEDGDLYVVDRRKDLLIVSGFNVYPAEVEDVVRTVPGVDDVVVVGRPDPSRGETIEAVVVTGRAGPAVTEDQIRDACARSLARYKCPTVVRFVDALPRGLVGKALRRAVREQQPA